MDSYGYNELEKILREKTDLELSMSLNGNMPESITTHKNLRGKNYFKLKIDENGK